MYVEEDLVKLARRDNNKKRTFLLVNPLQGKHIPVKPSETLELFKNLSNKLLNKYPKDKLLIIGFAETATAIGAAVAAETKSESWYIQTTREVIGGDECLFFSEVHSHATEQKLVTKDLDRVMAKVDRIVFAEDEITTGNTILNLKRVIEDKYGISHVKFSVVSILNGMSEENIARFSNEQIDSIYIKKIQQNSYEEKLSQYSYGDNLKYTCADSNILDTTPCDNYFIEEYINTREVVEIEKYREKCNMLTEKIIGNLDKYKFENKTVLILGAEEFMYPALLVGEKIENELKCKEVKFHATTRSPILPSIEEDYPLNSRYELRSFFDEERVIYLYNLKKYDKVLIIHDSKVTKGLGFELLQSALRKNECNDISIFQWGD